MTPIWPLLPVQTGSQSLIFKTNHISTTARGKLFFCTIVQIVNSQKEITKRLPNLTFTFCPNWKSKFNINKIISQQPQEVNSKLLNHCTDRYLSKNIYQKVTFTSCPNQKLKRRNILEPMCSAIPTWFVFQVM